MAEPKTEKAPKPIAANYLQCQECSRIEGEVVVYHKKSLRQESGLFEPGENWECPRGHVMEGYKP